MQDIENTLLLTGEHKLLYPSWDKGDNVDEYASIKCSQAKATKKYDITFLFTNEVDVLLKNLETEIMDKLLCDSVSPSMYLSSPVQGGGHTSWPLIWEGPKCCSPCWEPLTTAIK